MSNPEIVRESVGGVWETKVGSGGGGGDPALGGDLSGVASAAVVEKIDGVAVTLGGGSENDVLTQQGDGSFAPAAGGSPADVPLEDPGVAWQPDHVYSVGDRFAETIDGEVRVFEIVGAGTSGPGVFSDYGADLVPGPGNTWGTGSESWIYLGIVGQISWTLAPFLGGGLSVGPFEDAGHPLIYTTAAAPEDSEILFSCQATLPDGSTIQVVGVNTDGSGNHFLDEDAGASFIWTGRVVGGAAADVAEVGYEHFRTFAAAKLGFYGAPPQDQSAAIPAASGGGVQDVEARAALNALLAYLRLRGDIAAA